MTTVEVPVWPGTGGEPERFLSEQGCREILDRAMCFRSGGGDVELYIRSQWKGNLRWARNRVISSGDTTNHQIRIQRRVHGGAASVLTNEIHDDAIRDGVARAEYFLRHRTRSNVDILSPRRSEHYSTPPLWSDDTFHADASARGILQRQLVEPAIAAQLLAAGYLEVTATGHGVANSAGLFAYIPQTRAEYSVTVRNAKGTGSGWAGTEHRDWGRIDAAALSAIALDKCQRSADPVAIEPGRYTVILEPQATAEFVQPLLESFNRVLPERGRGPWKDPEWRDPILGWRAYWGQPVLDQRITIVSDPMDPDAPYIPFNSNGTPIRPITWIRNGLLTGLNYERTYALQELNQQDPLPRDGGFRMAGGSTSVADMIASTERGLLVTRFVNVRQEDYVTGTSTGTTSDGMWLIEKGNITMPVKNFRFRESPVHALNKVEAVGPTARVLMAQPTIVPALKIRDFNMIRLADAV